MAATVSPARRRGCGRCRHGLRDRSRAPRSMTVRCRASRAPGAPSRRSPAWRTTSRSHPAESRSWRARSATSEEHTSELQSRFDLVCRLLLEKKKHQRKHDLRDSIAEKKNRLKEIADDG